MVEFGVFFCWKCFQLVLCRVCCPRCEGDSSPGRTEINWEAVAGRVRTNSLIRLKGCLENHFSLDYSSPALTQCCSAAASPAMSVSTGFPRMPAVPCISLHGRTPRHSLLFTSEGWWHCCSLSQRTMGSSWTWSSVKQSQNKRGGG